MGRGALVHGDVVAGLAPCLCLEDAVDAAMLGGRGITVNIIQPGPIDTDLNPPAGDWATPQVALTALNRYGHVADVAALVAFIAGPEAAYITGANLTVDGGTNA